MENEELYLELLCQVLRSQHCIEEKINLLSLAFEVSSEKSQKLIENCSTRKQSNLILKVEIVSAKNLNLKNIFDGIFIVLEVDSNLDSKCKSTVLVSDVNPTWNENFAL